MVTVRVIQAYACSNGNWVHEVKKLKGQEKGERANG